ncbi:MAG: dATP/dGTP pyrophosphohydrolase domain-containing protein [Bradymonadia bacterium]
MPEGWTPAGCLGLDAFMVWAHETFPDTDGAKCAKHLRRETEELVQAIEEGTGNAKEEAVDCLCLSLHTAQRLCGPDLPRLIADKLHTNRHRKWAEPDAEGVREHVRDEVEKP